MNAYDFNKIAGWALSALLFIFGMQAAKEMFGSHGPVKAGYTLPMPKGGPAGAGGPAAPAGLEFAKVAEQLPKASVDAGKEVFKLCTNCHTPEKAGAVKQGPNLWGILGGDVGKNANFPKYSRAMAEKGGKWDWQSLANYIYDPKGFIPGNQMAFAGVKDEQDLAALLVYLRTLADAPVALPK
jgi:cytochrome c